MEVGTANWNVISSQAFHCESKGESHRNELLVRGRERERRRRERIDNVALKFHKKMGKL